MVITTIMLIKIVIIAVLEQFMWSTHYVILSQTNHNNLNLSEVKVGKLFSYSL